MPSINTHVCLRLGSTLECFLMTCFHAYSGASSFFLKIDYLEHCMSADSVLPTLLGPGCVQVMVMITGLITDLYIYHHSFSCENCLSCVFLVLEKWPLSKNLLVLSFAWRYLFHNCPSCFSHALVTFLQPSLGIVVLSCCCPNTMCHAN